MRGEWQEYIVRELQEIGQLLVEDGNHGEYRPRRDEFCKEGTAFIRASDMNRGRVLFDSASKINGTAVVRIRKGIGVGGDVLLSHKGTVGKLAMVPLDAPPFVCSPQTTFWRSLDPDAVDRRYLYAYMHSPHFRQQLDSRKGETDMADYVSLTAQREFRVLLPPIADQRAIAHILGSLDDKIELNRRMNETLEAMAQAIFKSWFVDFDPVRAKRDGRDTMLPGAIADLFPDSFEDSELGEIPEGWHTKPIYGCANFINGNAFKSTDFSEDNSGLPIIKIAELKNGITGQTKLTINQYEVKYNINTGDLLFSWSGSPDTSLNVFIWTLGRGWLNQHIFRVIPHREAERAFVYYLLKSLRPAFIEIARDKQTTGLGHVTVKDMKRMQVVFASDKFIDTFDKIIRPIYNKIISNSLESQTLADIRDGILPKLISGELRVPDVALELVAQAGVPDVDKLIEGVGV